MARGFDSTLGSGTTDSVTTASVSKPTLRSWHSWSNRNGIGGAAAGRIFQSAGSYEVLYYNSSNSTYAFQRKWSTQDGLWTFAQPTGGVWHGCGLSYDGNSTSNNPIVYLDGSSVTVTKVNAPTGTFGTTAGEITIGNNTDSGVRVWDGSIAEFACWDAILTAAEFAALGKGYSPLLIRPQSLVEYVPLIRSNVSYKNAAPTITGTAVQPHPRMVYPRNPSYQPIEPAFHFWAQRSSNVPILGTGIF